MLKRLLTARNLVILLLIIGVYVVSGWLGLKVVRPEVILAPEVIFHLGSFAVTNSLLTTWIAMVILILLAYFATRRIPRDLSSAASKDLVPKGFANALEMLIEGFYGMARGVAGSWAPRFFPIVMTIFLLVIVSNWLGLVPGFGSIGLLEHPKGEEATGHVANGAFLTAEPAASAEEGYILVPLTRSPSTDLNFTLALALSAVALTQYFGVKSQKMGYFTRFFNFPAFKNGALSGTVEFIAGLLEIVTEFAKIVSFSFRLFGNIFAGEVLLGVIAFLIPYFISLPFYGLEVFVGFIQALVFMMLTLVFFSLATAGHGAGQAAGHEAGPH